MGRHTRAEFAQICGLTPGNLSNYIKRGKVIIDGEFIDDTVFQNKEFIRKRNELKAQKQEDEPTKPAARLRNIKPDPGIEPDFGNEDDSDLIGNNDEENDLGRSTSAALNKKKLKVDIAKKIRETEILKLREQKIKGQIVPVDIIKNLFSMHTQSIITAQKDGIEELLINISAEYRLSGEQLSRLRGKMVQILNNAVDKAIIITQRSMRVVTEDFSIKKEVGEHE